SEERRVGKECRSRWSPNHVKKNLATKKTLTGTKTVKTSIKNEKTPEAVKAKPIRRSSSIERLAVAKTAPKEPQQKTVNKKTSKPVGNKTEKPQDKKPSRKSPGLFRDPSLFFFSSRRRHTSFSRDWSSDVCSSD